MDTVRRKSTAFGIVTLIVDTIFGIGIGVWEIKTSHATNAPNSTTPSATANSGNTNSNAGSNNNSIGQNKDQDPLLIDKNWNPFTDMERMHEQIDGAIRDATEKFSFEPGMDMFKPDAGYSSSFDLRDRKDHYELRSYLPDVNPSDVNVK